MCGWHGVELINTCAKLLVNESSTVPILRRLASSQLGSTGKQELTVQWDECHRGKGRGRVLQAEDIALPLGQVREHGQPRGGSSGGCLLTRDSSRGTILRKQG